MELIFENNKTILLLCCPLVKTITTPLTETKSVMTKRLHEALYPPTSSSANGVQQQTYKLNTQASQQITSDLLTTQAGQQVA